MISKHYKYILIGLIFAMAGMIISGCSNSTNGGKSPRSNPDSVRTTNHEFLAPQNSGIYVLEENGASIDASNTSEGYVMVGYFGGEGNMWLQITDPYGEIFSYSLKLGQYETFPLSSGSGVYKIDVLKNIQGDMYALIMTRQIEVNLSDEFKPFLYPNQYVWYQNGDKALDIGVELSDKSSDDFDYLSRVFHYVVDNISYDYDLASRVEVGYVPDSNRTLETKKGICFDYASLMSLMLRSQNIPTKLVVGYAGIEYHAWISVYMNGVGWMDNIIEFDGSNWSFVDPTLASTTSTSNMKKHSKDDGYYIVQYNY